MTNPYQSPTSAETVPELSTPELLALREQVRRRMRIPVVALVVCSIIGAFWSGIFVIAALWWFFSGAIGADELLPNAGGNALFAGYHAVLGIALSNLRRMESYGRAVLLAVLTAIPYLSPGFIFGVPFGVWLLVILRQSQSRLAFQRADGRAQLDELSSRSGDPRH